eukprot:contig_2052_g352
MIGPWMADIRDLLRAGVTVNGSLRAVRLFLNGDIDFVSNVLGLKGASARLPCVWCLVVGRPCKANEALVAAYGSMQEVAVNPTSLRTRSHLQAMMEAYAEQPNENLPLALQPARHLSIERCPLLDVWPSQIVPIPLHLTLGGTSIILRVVIEATLLESGREAAVAAASAVGLALLDDAGVRPVPYHGGGFEGRSCHRIARRGDRICDALAGHLSASRLGALRTASAEWAQIVGVLNRAQDVPVPAARDFKLRSQRFVAQLLVAFPWLSVSPKLHALAHHAPDFLLRFGSLGSNAEQALEAWHGFFNQARAQCTSASFEGACLQLVRRAALERQPSAAQGLYNGERRAAAAPGSRLARKPGDGRLRVNKPDYGRATAAHTKEQVYMRAWADGRVAGADVTIRAYKNRLLRAEKLAEDEAQLAAAVEAESDILEEEEWDPVAAFLLL